MVKIDSTTGVAAFEKVFFLPDRGGKTPNKFIACSISPDGTKYIAGTDKVA